MLEEYAGLADHLDAIRQWWREDPTTAIQRYENELRASERSSKATKMGDARRKVSQYFLRLRALCEKGMLDPELVAATLGDEPVQVFLLYIDSLDEIVRRVAGKPHKTAERDYFHSYLKKYFSDTATTDPWGLRNTAVSQVRTSEGGLRDNECCG
ncbi:MAG: hypothetical protein A2X87_00390 [Deltaproteobacteria bacterium GWC2_42_51]|nr:MAG: hypothetical protein A2067_05050 [Deltaproteobacteria bacterium GWB2_42_7]OGP36437.1 MAG: hypothetical protein A2X87_00390 [Deltaproteobacteria bacterium GWC2_42_51]OGP39780.1 MAG: hypothetical protein A2090_04620 [Deltaproteobacteria bacterium GWD2_42_10]OGP48398.1 MAG: hypothetical protein A2022_10160 [Deltaproteobacteria bacterium GWF2_42_12]OGQ29438.1 MAG: hypothetical protein A3D29_01730 [Deltaproteobacteria bacterium RIFCSPHIGHO2_02_FULL_42_44]OGQ36067.1 MAG: hypothetical protein